MTQREKLQAIAAEAVAVVEQGGYRNLAGTWVDIAQATSAAVAGTRLYLPGEPLLIDSDRNGSPLIEVTNESTLEASRRVGGDVAALVFASARNPGGGFLTGAQAQEESIARSSALYACQTAVPDFYDYHRADRDLRYSDRVIYSPAVPVFREDAGRLIEQPHQVAMLTVAAPNLGAILSNSPQLGSTVPGVLHHRAVRLLQVAAAHGHRHLVLGAWGCGVFRNDPTTVAEAFAAALREVDRFDYVVFAIMDPSAESPAYRAFLRTFRQP